MHIHGGQLNPNPALHGARASESAQSARRADATRKKLFGAAAEMSSISEADNAWSIWMAGSMSGAWGEGGSASNSGQQNTTWHESGPESGPGSGSGFGSGSGSGEPGSRAEEVPRASGHESARVPDQAAVSFWA